MIDKMELVTYRELLIARGVKQMKLRVKDYGFTAFKFELGHHALR